MRVENSESLIYLFIYLVLFLVNESIALHLHDVQIKHLIHKETLSYLETVT